MRLVEVLGLVFGSLALSSSIARAEPTVVILQPEPGDSVLGQALIRLENELKSAGFEIVLGPGPDHDPRWELEHASTPGTMVTITLRRADNEEAVDLWVLDRLSGKTLIRRVQVSLNEPNAPTILAVRATELIRASLLEITVKPAIGATPRPPIPPVVGRWMTPSREIFSTFHVQMGATALYSYGLGVSFLPAIRVGFPSVGPVAVRILAASTIVPGSSVSIDGRAEFDEQLLGVEAALGLHRAAKWVPFFSLGFGAWHLHVTGQSTSDPYANGDSSVWAPYGDAGFGVAFVASDHLTVIADLHAIFTIPRERVTIGEQSAGIVGAPSWAIGAHALFEL
jgi:hypothetical protein